MLQFFYQNRKSYLIFLIILGIFFVFQGCASKKKADQKKDVFFETWKLRALESKGHSPSPIPKEKVNIPKSKKTKQELIKPDPDKRLPKEKVTLKMENEDIGLVLRTLARGVGQNIMIGADIKGKMNIDVKATPWNEAFLGALRTQGLTYTWEGNIVRVISIKDMKNDLAVLQNEVKQKQMKLKMQEVDTLLTKVIKVSYADAKALSGRLDKMLKQRSDKKERGYVMLDNHTHSLIIRAVREDMLWVLDVINEIDQPIRQIHIKADIVEATREIARDLGIQWGGRYSASIGNYNGYVLPGSSSVDGSTNSPVFGGGNSGNGFGVNFPANLAEDAGASLGLMFGTLGGNILEMQLSALEAEGKINILSQPSITTLDNQMAFTESGAEVPFVTYTMDDNEKTTEIEFKDVVLRLEITPHIIDDKTLKMQIKVTKDEIDFANQVQGNPIIRKRHTQTSLIVQDTETIVISGLSKTYNSSSESGVPKLKEMPGLGWAFKNNGKQNTKEEILIFITPNILKQRMAMDIPESQIEDRNIPLDGKSLDAPDK
jgi:type IV pilus assembly protein PilQ